MGELFAYYAALQSGQSEAGLETAHAVGKVARCKKGRAIARPFFVEPSIRRRPRMLSGTFSNRRDQPRKRRRAITPNRPRPASIMA
jgi:hypothetical protein